MLNLYSADFFIASASIADGSVAMIFADIPYNVTQAKWDKNVWDLQAMWAIFNRVLRPNGVVIMTATM
jgi:site-specific DNA-methyltransferase (adenine-specific)